MLTNAEKPWALCLGQRRDPLLSLCGPGEGGVSRSSSEPNRKESPWSSFAFPSDPYLSLGFLTVDRALADLPLGGCCGAQAQEVCGDPAPQVDVSRGAASAPSFWGPLIPMVVHGHHGNGRR